MANYEKLKKLLKKETCMQGVNGVPYFLSTAAYSGMMMDKVLGYRYSLFIFNYKNNYLEGHYSKADFVRIWKIIKSKIKKEPNYLAKIKKIYDRQFASHKDFLAELDGINLKKISGQRLFLIFKKSFQIQVDSFGVAHIIEAIGAEGEKEFKELLYKEIKNKSDFNKYFIILTTPSAPSYIAQEEKELLMIKNKKDKKYLLQKHAQKYFWLADSFVGSQKLTWQWFGKRLESLADRKDKKANLEDKNLLIKKLKLSRELQKLISIIELATIWQDERKINVLTAIHYADKIITEIARRLKINKEILYYLNVKNISAVKSLKDIQKKAKKLRDRKNGVWLVMENVQEEWEVGGKDYDKLLNYKKSREKDSWDNKELHGSIACGGTAIGRVKICKHIESLGKFEKGDILVTSMTRPEFMPALRKSAAIITDEGGVTCHAAIVARELNIPAVIGTKIATKVLRDGMIVEVRANHGLVRIIK